MHYSKRLGISLLAGLAAFLGNHMYLASQFRSESFVSVARDVRPGQSIVEQDLRSVSLSGDLDQFRKSAVVWSERATLFDRASGQGLAKGDIVLWQNVRSGYPTPILKKDELPVPISTRGLDMVIDFLHVNDYVHVITASSEGSDKPSTLRFLGPFRIAAVNQRVSPDEMPEGGAQGRAAVLTLAVPLLAQNGTAESAKTVGKDGEMLVNASQGLNGCRIVQIAAAPRN